MELRYNQYELQLIVAAILYEKYNRLIMSDAYFDASAKELEQQGTKIPNFNASTGLWVYDVIKEEPWLEAFACYIAMQFTHASSKEIINAWRTLNDN